MIPFVLGGVHGDEVNGVEIVNAYSELVDPIEQMKRLEEQAVNTKTVATAVGRCSLGVFAGLS